MASPKILFWPKDRKLATASFRIRCKNVVDGLVETGISAGYFSSAADYLGRLSPWYRPPQILVLSKRVKISSLRRAVVMKRRYGTKLILDLCDNIFFEQEGRNEIRNRQIANAINAFDVIVTPSDFLREQIAAHLRPDMQFAFIPDAVEDDPKGGLYRKWRERRGYAELKRVKSDLASSGVAPGRRLVWFGNHGRESARNGMYDIERISEILCKHHEEGPISLTVISNNRERYEQLFSNKPFRCFYQEWNYYTINETLRLHDIAVIPIGQSDFSMAKSANRLTTAFASGLAVCATSIDSYKPFQDAAVLDDWLDGLRHLMASAEERARRISAGRAQIETSFTLEAVCRQWVNLFEELS